MDVDASILNIANTNIIGGNWWIVLVNEAGNWIGKIFAPSGSNIGNNYASAPGTASQVADSGAITITNEGNGGGSTNTGNITNEQTNQTVQTNNAAIVNNIYLTANTGDNSASRNTGGNNTIKTGDANIQFNLINFLNNNIANANVFLTVVNVFGSWVGDFVAPGATKTVVEENNTPEESAIGGVADLPSSNSQNSSSSPSSSSSNDSSNSNNSNSTNSGGVLSANNALPRFTPFPLGGKVASGVSDQTADDLALANSDSPSSGAAEGSKMRINLAWGFAAIPLYLIMRFARKRLVGA